MAQFKDTPEKELANLRAHYGAGLSWAPGAPANTPETKKFRYVLPYTNPRGSSVEFPEFFSAYLDEWLAGRHH